MLDNENENENASAADIFALFFAELDTKLQGLVDSNEVIRREIAGIWTLMRSGQVDLRDYFTKRIDSLEFQVRLNSREIAALRQVVSAHIEHHVPGTPHAPQDAALPTADAA